MTSRDSSKRMTWDRLETMIRWTLRESVRDIAPRPEVWERIESRVPKTDEAKRIAWRQLFQLGRRSVARWLSESPAVLPSEFAYYRRWGLGEIREQAYRCLLVHQCDLPILLDQAI